jgi:hypothetical protein
LRLMFRPLWRVLRSVGHIEELRTKIETQRN